MARSAMARSATTVLLIGILAVLLWLPASGAHKLESLGSIRRIPGRPMKANPVVILFLHVPKCGGSTVRSIFKYNQWHMTHWSLTQRYEGSWHANRLLNGIRTQLAGNKSKIFVEWHLEVNFSFVPELETHIHRMRPGVRLIIFTILRQPNYLIRSAYAYFAVNCPVTLAITLHPENFLFTTLNLTLPLQSTPPNGTSVCDWQPELRDVCEDAAIWQASFRLIKQNRRNQTWPFDGTYDGTSFDRSRVAIRSGQEVVLKGERRRANSIVERMVAIRQWSHRVGCATLVDDGLRMLAPIHHILRNARSLASPSEWPLALQRGSNRTKRQQRPPMPRRRTSAPTCSMIACGLADGHTCMSNPSRRSRLLCQHHLSRRASAAVDAQVHTKQHVRGVEPHRKYTDKHWAPFYTDAISNMY